MAFAEKRGKWWRVRYKRPDGVLDSASGFPTKESALEWGRDQETDVRRNAWRDPHAGDITLADWIDTDWWPGQDLALRTRGNYRYIIDNYLIPEFGGRPLNTLTSPSEINRWEARLRQRVPAVATAARGRLATILADAVDEGLIDINPAIRARRRGRKSARTQRREQPPVTSLQLLLLAERCAVLSGRDDEFIEIVTIGYPGMRYGETIGVEPEHVKPDILALRWQLAENAGRFYRLPPKDDSARDIDLPPFLGALLARQKSAMSGRRCAHTTSTAPPGAEEPCPAGRRYLWLGTDGGHLRNSNFARRIFAPATTGWYPNGAKKQNRPAKPVLVDVACHWPGRLLPAWPAATPGEAFQPPWGRGRGLPRLDLENVYVASWLPLLPGLTPHGLRHAHNTWMIEDGIPEVLRHARLGHRMEGIKAVYSHVTPQMRSRLIAALEQRWNDALAARARIAPHSPVAALEALLAEEADRRAS